MAKGEYSIESWKTQADGVAEVAKPTGLKYDEGKLRVDLVPLDSLMKVAGVYTYGALKYTTPTSSGEENWRGGISWKRVFGAIMRHTWAWYLGQDLDPESGHPHLAHAAFGLLTLLNYSDTHPELDDRPYKPLNSLKGTDAKV